MADKELSPEEVAAFIARGFYDTKPGKPNKRAGRYYRIMNDVYKGALPLKEGKNTDPNDTIISE